MKLEERLLELLNIESTHPDQDRVNEIIDLLSEKIQMKYRYFKDKYVLFSNYDLFNLPEDKEILMITNHFDTVSPFTNQINYIENDVVYGRGSVDDKPNTAVMIELLEEIQTDKVFLYGITFDEERDVQGCKQLVDFLQILNIHPDNILLVEPTNMKPSCNSHGNINGFTWNRLEQNEDSFLFNKLKEMNMEQYLPITPPCEAGDYKTLGSNVVICGPGLTYLCHSDNEYIDISELYEWKERLRWLMENNLK